MEDRERGLYDKYKVTRTDGRRLGDCIVLEWDDPNGRAGIKAFSEAVRANGYTALADDLDLRLRAYAGLADMTAPELYEEWDACERFRNEIAPDDYAAAGNDLRRAYWRLLAIERLLKKTA